MLAYPACGKEAQMQFSHQSKWITRKLLVNKKYKKVQVREDYYTFTKRGKTFKKFRKRI